MLTDAAQLYSGLFAPERFVLLCGLLLVGYEWNGSDRSLAGLGARVGVLGLGWVVAFAIYQGVPRAVGTLPEWGPDATGSAGLGLGILLIWLIWRLREWGDLVSGFALLLVGATVPHLLITPVWDVSSHVLYAAVPAGYLSLVDSRFAPSRSPPSGWYSPDPSPAPTAGRSRSAVSCSQSRVWSPSAGFALRRSGGRSRARGRNNVSF